ncbi:MAG TPA: AraC family transcriptional regulator [Ruminiclostridium sp.]
MQSPQISFKPITSERAKKMLLYIQAGGSFLCEPSYVIKRKKYDSILVILTLSGKGYIKYHNKTHEMIKGTVTAIDCNDPHVYFTDKKELWKFMWIHFKGGQSLEQIRFILDNHEPVFYTRPNSTIKSNVIKIYDYLQKSGLQYEILTSFCLNDILSNLLISSLSDIDWNKKTPDIIINAKEALEAGYKNRIDMDEFSNAMYINKFDLIRKFKKHIGITPYEYLIKFRINQSKNFLESTDLSITEIAESVGFEDCSHFIKMFKQYEKTTPLQYRKFWSKVF